jgi:hypothetical protein
MLTSDDTLHDFTSVQTLSFLSSLTRHKTVLVTSNNDSKVLVSSQELFNSMAPVPQRSLPSIVLRRARMVPDGTGVEALAIINYGHNTTSHRTRVVSTTRRDIHPITGVPSHAPAPLGNILFPKSEDLSGFQKIRTHPRKLSCHASSTNRRLPLNGPSPAK